jgi:AmmeMemoRadiSam system protein A
MVPLHFFGRAAGNDGDDGGADSAAKGAQVVRIGLSGLSREMHERLGEAVARVAEELKRPTVVIASGDLSHKLLASGPYGYAPEGPEFDRQLCDALANGDVAAMMALDPDLSEAAAECGLRSFIMMGGALKGAASTLGFASELLSYEGPFGVGYAVAAYELALPESLPIALARRALQSFFERGGRRPKLDTPAIVAFLREQRETPEGAAYFEQLARRRAGAFVSLHEDGALRGCIGTIAPATECVLAEIVHNAVSAALEDPRFPPVQEDELLHLDIKVDVLAPPEPVSDLSMLDAERYGVIVSSGWRRGLLLPALEGVDTPAEQIAIALAKAGIAEDEAYDLERFEVVRYI